MAKKTQQQIREDVTNLFVFEYIPELKKEVSRFNVESLQKHNVANEVSKICNARIGVYLGELKIADPTNELIDKLVDYVRVQINK